jgi:uncharacterized protein
VSVPVTIDSELLATVRREFALSLEGVHGESHWARVRENGLRLAEITGADVQIVEFFAYLHDVKRLNDGWDPEHGLRAAAFVSKLPRALVPVSDKGLEVLTFACTYHSDGLTKASITVQTCWDADRLDLGRVNIQPDPQRMCTQTAKDPALIEWAFERSQYARRGST